MKKEYVEQGRKVIIFSASGSKCDEMFVDTKWVRTLAGLASSMYEKLLNVKESDIYRQTVISNFDIKNAMMSECDALHPIDSITHVVKDHGRDKIICKPFEAVTCDDFRGLDRGNQFTKAPVNSEDDLSEWIQEFTDVAGAELQKDKDELNLRDEKESMRAASARVEQFAADLQKEVESVPEYGFSEPGSTSAATHELDNDEIEDIQREESAQDMAEAMKKLETSLMSFLGTEITEDPENNGQRPYTEDYQNEPEDAPDVAESVSKHWT
jgi:hypothetical protein